MTKEELEEIINSHRWIKVNSYYKPNQSNDWRYQHEMLEVHHRKETDFLINKCRELAKELMETQEKVTWSTNPLYLNPHTPHKDEWGNTDWRDKGEMGG